MPLRAPPRRSFARVLTLVLASGALFALAADGMTPRAGAGEDASPSEGGNVVVDKDLIQLDDGDTVVIRWPEGAEVVRILGIDTPEVFHPEHDLPYPQAFGERATGFLEGCLAVAKKVELLRAPDSDPHGRTLGYLFFDGLNYSVLAIRARLAVETVGHFGDNGLPEPAAACVAAAEDAGPVPFEPPYRYRARMKKVAAWLRAAGRYPCAEGATEDEEGR